MQVPLEIQFRNMDASEAVEAAARESVAKLERLADSIVSCRVTIEAPHRRHQQGNLYSVSIDLRYAGGEAVANRAPTAKHAHEDVYVALRDAFKAVRRQIEDRVRVRRGDVKRHSEQSHGTIVSLDKRADYGRIGTPDGREIYFHRNSVLNAKFDALEVGMEVRFDEEAGDQGPQASTVHVTGKHRVAG
ncbi:MAG TPA: HPF/RaiA family ribosome-associated protein [Gammaproteobacteria bacterium]|jgi:ribosomal subunit interface protein|nr:HPF/RaiA family ribosome-associated protein [Gammaproteobacteria bacterium]